jgi:N-acetylneuraminate synthase/N,N'-diacetyllegionaminate synthase
MANSLNVGRKQIGDGKPVFIIAEAGLNHNGRLRLAKEMIAKAVEAKADAIKFQTYRTIDFIGQKSPYYKLFKKYELSFPEFEELSNFAEDQGIIFLSTPLDFASADFLDSLNVPAFKVASGDITNLPFLEHLSKKGKTIILSTGMSTLEEVSTAVEAIRSAGNQGIILLHCLSTYPASFENVNLRAICTLSDTFHVPVGFSDHTQNSLTPVVAVAMGASVIEKHFTLNKKLKGPDHSCSFNPQEFGVMVRSVRQVEEMLGSGAKEPSEEEISLRELARRSIFARVKIAAGAKITESMLSFSRPGDGISPMDIRSVIGRCAKANIDKDEKLALDKLK